MKEEEKSKKKLVKEGLGPWHGPCQASGHARLNFLHFLESCLDNYQQNNLKQLKTNKIKAIKLVGCLPRSARLKSLA